MKNENLTDNETTILCTALDKEKRAILQEIANNISRSLNERTTATTTIIKNMNMQMSRLEEIIELDSKFYRDTL